MQVEQSLKVVEIVALGMDPPVVLDADTPLSEVLQRMRDKNSGCALVTRETRLAAFGPRLAGCKRSVPDPRIGPDSV